METCSCTPVPRLHQSQLPHQLGSGADHLLRQVATKRVPAAGANKGRRGGGGGPCMVASPRGWHPQLRRRSKAAAGEAALCALRSARKACQGPYVLNPSGGVLARPS